jgi:tight adherence protein B
MDSGGIEMILLVISSSLLSGILWVILLQVILREKLLVTDRLERLSGKTQIERTREKRKQKQRTGKAGFKILNKLAAELSTAGILMRPEEYLTIWIVLGVVPAAITAMSSGSAVTSIGLAVIGIGLPPFIIKRKKMQRLQQFEKQLSDALLVACNCLRSGLTFQQAMESIAQEMPDPIAAEFARTLREIRLGSSLERAMEHLQKRVPSGDLMLLVSAVLIQRQVGGNLSEILESISGTIQERLKLKDAIRVLTATGRASGLVIGCLPIGIALILMLINPTYIESFFNTKTGIQMLITAAVMECIGFLILQRIVTIKY